MLYELQITVTHLENISICMNPSKFRMILKSDTKSHKLRYEQKNPIGAFLLFITVGNDIWCNIL